MITLKPNKSLARFAAPVKRTAIRKIPISNLKTRLYKFPYLTLSVPMIDEVEALPFSQIRLKLRFWTERFFSLTLPDIHQHVISTFRYQLKKYGIDIDYDFDFNVYDLSLEYEAKLSEVRTTIHRKRVRKPEGLASNYQIGLREIDVPIVLHDAIYGHFLRLQASVASDKVGPLKFPPLRSGKPSDLQPDGQGAPAEAVDEFKTLKTNIVPTPFSKLKIKRIKKSEDLALAVAVESETIQLTVTPAIHNIDTQSLSIYQLSHDKAKADAESAESTQKQKSAQPTSEAS